MSEVTNELTGLMKYIQPLQLSKSKAEENSYSIYEMVVGGEASALDLSTKLQYISDVCLEARKLIRQHAVQEMDMYDKKEEVSINGAKVEVGETGVKYDYSTCNDKEWADLMNGEEIIANRRKDREKFLRSIKKPMGIANEATEGETMMVNPPVKSSTTNVKITFPK